MSNSPMRSEVMELEPSQLAARVATGNLPQLIDVRDAWEWNISRIENAQHIPVAEFSLARAALSPDDEVVVFCHHGVRSHMVAQFLVNNGFTRVWNLAGGIDRYSVDVDPAVPRY